MPNRTPYWLLAILIISLITSFFVIGPVSAAIAPAGAVITNRAEVSWFDTKDGLTKSILSNESTIVVAELVALDLERDNAVHATAGQLVSLPHRLINTGNIETAYQLEVLQDQADAADLANLKAFTDSNGNGIADAGESELVPVTCANTSAPAGTVCYDLPELQPGDIYEFALVGMTDAARQPGDIYNVDLSVAATRDPSKSASNRDVIDIIDGPNLAIYKSVAPVCGTDVRALDVINYSINFTNTGNEAPAGREYEIDGSLINGAVLEDVIPPNTNLLKTSNINFAPTQAIPVVQLKIHEDTHRWITFDAWDGTALLSKVGLYVPVENMQSNQSGKLEFEVVVDSQPTTSTIYNQAYFEFDVDATKDFLSNQVCTMLVADKPTSGSGGGSGSSGNDAIIKFLTPALNNKINGAAPGFSSTTDLVDASYYSLDSGLSTYDPTRDGVYIEMHSSAFNTDEDTADTVVVEVVSGSGDTLLVRMQETGPNTGIFRNISPIRLSENDQGAGRYCPFSSSAQPDYTSSDYNCVLQGSSDGSLTVQTVGAEPGTGTVLSDTALIDPLGVVFDSAFRNPVENATVIVRNASDDSIAIDPLTGQPYAPQTTGADGRYQFPFLFPGDYYVDVTPPGGYTAPSVWPPATFTDDGRVVNQYSYGRDGIAGSPADTGVFTLTAGDPPLVVDIPIDPNIASNPANYLQLTKEASDPKVAVGEFLTYVIKIQNKTPDRLYAIKIEDTLPYGFRYVNDTTFLNGELVGDPVGAPGPNLVFENLPFVDGEADGVLDHVEHTLTYKVRVSAGGLDGDGVNSAVANGRTPTSATIVSNTSRAKVGISKDGVLSSNGIVFGKVYMDTDCDGQQTDGEWPIGGVKLYMEDGTWVITDGNGQYSLYGVKPGSHVIKIDPITLPDGVSMKPIDNRHLADPESRLVDLVAGEFHRADFAASCPKEDVQYVYDQIKARNTGRTDWMLENAQKYDPDKSYVVDDLRRKTGADGDLSNGTVGFEAEGREKRNSKTADSNRSKPGINRGYAVQIEKYLSPKAAGFAVTRLPQELKAEAYVYPMGDFHTVRYGFSLSKKGIADAQSRVKKAGIKGEVVSTIYERLPMETIDRIEAPVSIGVMPKAQQVVKNITRKQAKAGTWLWPQGDTSLDGRFMVVVRGGLTPTLVVNGKSVSSQQIGERIANKRSKAQVVAWYGVKLDAGENIIEVAAKDPFGNMRTLAKKTVKRPDTAETIEFVLERDDLPADGGRSYLPVTIKLLDKNGYPARGIEYVTLESTDGSFVERDIQDKTPGKQIRITNGKRVVHLRSSEHTGEIKIRASAGSKLKTEAMVTQVAPLRPLVAAGLIDIRGSKALGFDDRDNAPASRQDESDIDGRAALFMKGKIKGDMHLTFSVDTDKDDDEERFRDINPNSYYPMYGDDSRRGYDAQSRSKVYGKLEKGKNSVMWGDYLTDPGSNSTSVARVQRSLTGANGVLDNGKTRFQIFAAEVEDNNITEEIRGQGTALNYQISKRPVIRNSEVVELVTYSRDNPGVVVSVEPLTRFGDYTLDDLSGYLSFTDSIPAQDENLNPVYIRVSYDVEEDGEEHLVAGFRLNHQVTDELNLGVSHTTDENPTDGKKITGVTGEYKKGKTKITASAANLKHEDGTKDDGNAMRVEVEHKWDKSGSSKLGYARADQGFDNQAGGVSAGREEIRATHKQKLNDKISVDVDAIHSKETDTGATEQSLGVIANVKQDKWTLRAGSRHIRQKNTADNESFTTFIVGAKRPIEMLGRKGSFDAEYEQDFGRTDRKRISIGGDIQVHDHVKLYGKAERINSLTGVSGLSTTDQRDTLSIGVKSNVFKSTELYSEYRLRGVTDGRDMETASGIRGTYELEKGLSVSPRLEVVNNLQGNGKDSVAISVGLKDSRNVNQRKTARLEARHDDDRTYYGVEGSYASRINEDWSGLLRESLRVDDPDQGDTVISNTFTVGLAHRPRRDNRHNMLFFYENKIERGSEVEGDCTTHILSTHQNYEIREDVLLSGRAGGKAENCKKGGVSTTSDAMLLDGRVIWDISKRWDLDVHGGVLATDGFDEKQYAFGVGANFLVRRNLRLGVGYNLIGFKDEDLDAEGYNKEGVYFGLQYKFDENSLDWLTGEEEEEK